MRPQFVFVVLLWTSIPASAQETAWRSDDPAVPHPNRPPFCAGVPALSLPTAPAVGDRWGRIEVEADCASIPRARCFGGPVTRQVRVRPTGCVVERAYAGTAAGPVEVPLPPDDRLVCAECPPAPGGVGTGSDGTFRVCEPNEVAVGRRQPVLFDVRAAEVRRLQGLYTEARRLQAAGGRTAEWQNRLLEIVRAVARTVAYCDAAPPLLPHDPRWSWTYDDHRIDLARRLVFGGRTGLEGTALEVEPMPELLHAYPGAFPGATPETLDFDALAMALLHEMRHMATYQFGGGMQRHSAEEMDAEHRLNELEDYSEMFRHPFFATVPADRQAVMRSQFGQGRQAELECFAAVWGANDATRGYPDDAPSPGGRAVASRPSLARPMAGGPMMMGGLGLMGPLMMGAMPAGAGVLTPLRPPMAVPSPVPRRCASGRLNKESRCRVAYWAVHNAWMDRRMVRSGFSTGEAQPWNTLAHYVMALPFRARRFCPDEPRN